MKIVHDALKACGYGEQESFSFAYRWNDTEYCRQIYPFVSKQYPDDVYLLVSLQPAELAHALDNGFMSALALSFRKQMFHRSAMDRNTTLLLSCLCNTGEYIEHNLRVQLEDDPYYFKKYVFAYTLEDEAAAVRYVEENNRDNGSLIETIRGCLLNTALFAAYKEDDSAQKAYGYFVELATKVTILPIQPNSDNSIESVEAIWCAELRESQEIDMEALENVLELDADKPEEMLDRWSELTKAISG